MKRRIKNNVFISITQSKLDVKNAVVIKKYISKTNCNDEFRYKKRMFDKICYIAKPWCMCVHNRKGMLDWIQSKGLVVMETTTESE